MRITKIQNQKEKQNWKLLNTGKNLEEQESYSLLIAKQNCMAIFEESLLVSYKDENHLII
jgi:hypothetical protein